MSKLGINGLGRVGKLVVWNQVNTKHFSELVVNLGREAGQGLGDIANFVKKDSTYGRLASFLHGYNATGRIIEELNEAEGSMRINGLKVTFLQEHRNPINIDWGDHGVELVIDTTGAFLDPTIPADDPRGSVRGHLEAGAKKVIVSAPFKIKDKGQRMPGDATTVVMGINEADYNPQRHQIISGASCSTTCLAFMMRPLLDHFGVGEILSASMVTVHATTGSQKVLDHLPKAGAIDLRKSRSVFNNIILTGTGAAKTLELVIPEMKSIGFIAESVRIPTNTASLIILSILIKSNGHIGKEEINNIYKEASGRYREGYLVYSDSQNVSSDMIGLPSAAAVIEGYETHTRTSFIVIPDSKIPVTQAVVYAWYDNEMGSYVWMLRHLTNHVAAGL